MKKSEVFELEEKKKEFIYWVLFVVVLIVLFLGDQIALRFISKNPNPNNTVFGNKEKIEYKIDFLEELNIVQVLEKINAKENFLLLSTHDKCETCKMYLPDLKIVFNDHFIHGYYINYSFLNVDSNEYREFIMKDEDIKSKLTYTPYLMYFENGILKDDVVGRIEQKEIENFVITNDCIK